MRSVYARLLLLLRNLTVKTGTVVLCLISLSSTTSVHASTLEKTSRVLIVSDESSVMPGVVAIERNAEYAIRNAGLGRIEFNAEYFDTGRISESGLRGLFLDYVRKKYALHPPDVIIVQGSSLDFAADFANSVSPDVPIVLACLTERDVSSGRFGSRVTGFVQRLDIAGTLNLIVRLQQTVRRIIVVGGTSDWDTMYLNKVREDARSMAGHVAFEFWNDRPMAALQKDVASLDGASAILFTSMFRDAAGETFVPSEAARQIVEHAGVPVYGLYAGIVDAGAVGGSVIRFETMGKRAGEIAAGLLRGNASALGPIQILKEGVPVFNWAALRRWGIDEHRLPKGSIVRFRSASAWETYRWYLIGALAIIALQASLIIGLFMQRFRLRAVEGTLRESHDLTELATTAGHLGLWVRDLTSGEMWANRRLRSILGFGDDVALRMEDIYARLDPVDRDRVLAFFETVVREGQTFEIECRLLLPDGAKRWIFVKGSCVLDSEGRPVRTQGVVVDRTDIKRADLDAERQREAIAHFQRVSTMGELAASLAHELNQPLTAILSNVQAAQRFLAADPADVEEVQEILRDVVEDDNRASEVIRRLRALVRKEPLNFVPLDMSNVVREVVNLIHSDAVLHNVGVSIDCADDLPQVWGDKIQLPQVVLNLIANAFDAMKEKPAGERRVVVRIEQEDAYSVKVGVRDYGTGLSVDMIDNIFEPFYTTKPNGIGMGLTISRSIVEAHGGRLWAANNADRGATFYFTVRFDRRRSTRVKSESERKREEGDHLGEQSAGHRISDR